jgi:hypothetical protein
VALSDRADYTQVSTVGCREMRSVANRPILWGWASEGRAPDCPRMRPGVSSTVSKRGPEAPREEEASHHDHYHSC